MHLTSTANFQNESKLFDLPLEIRLLIYSHFINKHGYHVVSSTESELALTPCLGARLYDGDVGKERQVTELVIRPEPSDQRRYERRLRSSWGPHWMCEEFWMGGALPIMRYKQHSDPEKSGMEGLGMDLSSLYPLLRLCRRTYEEVMEWVAAEADFHIVDVQTLMILGDMSPSHDQNGMDDSNLGLQTSIVHRIQKLSLTLSRPLAFFQAHESSSLLGTAHSSSDLENTMEARTSPTRDLQTGFSRLREFTLWLDHTGTEYWSVISERALLAPVLQEVAAYSSLNFVVVLPKTHPTLASGERHYLDNTLKTNSAGTSSASLSATIHRVYRQRLRDTSGSDGQSGYVEWIHDFPHLLGHGFSRGQDMAEVEDLETKNWSMGVDTVRELRSMGYGGRFFNRRRRR
ncbi:hypothetical protein CC79DRAFT_1112604 [Sarocladium strictum]